MDYLCDGILLGYKEEQIFVVCEKIGNFQMMILSKIYSSRGKCD